MSNYIRCLNTFAEVAAWYAAIRPMVSKHHKKEDDLRPVGERTDQPLQE